MAIFTPSVLIETLKDNPEFEGELAWAQAKMRKINGSRLRIAANLISQES
jgi:hypothetical protein